MLKVLVMVLMTMGTFLLLPPLASATQGQDGLRIVVNLPSRALMLYHGETLMETYAVGIGTRNHQTPIGSYQIMAKEKNPIWIKPGDGPQVRIESGPENPLGYRWIEFDGLYGIHGTNRPESIGGYVSNGCIRMKEAEVEALYDLVSVGTPIEITYQRIFWDTAEDGTVFLRLYPDEYEMQPVTLESIETKLEKLGLAGFVDRNVLLSYIEQANGNPLQLGKTFPLIVYGKKIEARGVYRNGAYSIPVVPIAVEQKLDVRWDAASGIISSEYGSAPGYVKGDILYMSVEDLYAVFHLYGSWNPMQNTMWLECCQEKFY